MSSSKETERNLGLMAATGVGVGAIVGGGILALAGAAFATTGPAAILAFGLNGFIALLTALSFAEMASKFPESGGTYAFSKKVLSVDAAFTVGWVVWFASIVAAALYALGFAYFALVLVGDLWQAIVRAPASWLRHSWTVTAVAVVTTGLLAISLTRKASGGGHWANIGKVVVFGLLILGGLWAVVRQPPGETSAALRPFFTAGVGGLIQAMGYTFIALQGFDLIAAVGGEVKQPEKTIPRSMILSLAIALVIYLPLLFVITTVGTSSDQSIAEAAAGDPEGIVALAAQKFLGRFGYWLVIVAAVLSMFSALSANLFAASRIAQTMARDRNLPAWLSLLNPRSGTPGPAIVVTSLLAATIIIALPDVSAAGAASSLIFLVTFALAHWVAILVRQRGTRRPPPFRVPLFPAVPVVGGLACIALAIFQGLAVPSAGLIAIIWLSVGGILFLALFARRARIRDASSTAADPELLTLRGRTPLVLVPIANPGNAEAMLALADALVPADVGRVLMQTVVVAEPGWLPDRNPAPLERSQAVLRELLKASAKIGVRAEALLTVGPSPMEEIARVASLHRCESVLLGLSDIEQDSDSSPLESLLGTLDVDVVVLRARTDWTLSQARRILVPVAGRSGHEPLRAKLLSSLMRINRREVTLLRVLPTAADDARMRRAKRELAQVEAGDVSSAVEVLRSDDPAGCVAERAEQADLMLLGVQRQGRRKKLFGDFTRQIAQRSTCPLIVMSRRG